MVGINMETKPTNFEENPFFICGQRAESLIINVLEYLGYYIIPKRDYSKNGAPQCYNYDDKLSLPDIQIAKDGKTWYVEVKSKPSRWKHPDTGLNEKHFNHYKKIEEITGIKVFLIFYDEGYIDNKVSYINTKNTTYGNFISEISLKICGYPRIENRYFPSIIYFKYPECFIKICSNNILLDYKNNKELLKKIFSDIFK